MLNMSESKTIVQGKLDTPNGLSVDWIGNNIYWTDNEHKVCLILRKYTRILYRYRFFI